MYKSVFCAHMCLQTLVFTSQIHAAYADIRKAFDQVGHSYLIRKLGQLAVHPCLLDWIKYYLRDMSKSWNTAQVSLMFRLAFRRAVTLDSYYLLFILMTS